MNLTNIKHKAKKDWDEIVKFCKDRKDGPSQYIHENFLEETIDRTALSILDMVEGEIREREKCLENGSKSLDEEGKLKTYERILECSSTRFRLQALRAEIEGKPVCPVHQALGHDPQDVCCCGKDKGKKGCCARCMGYDKSEVMCENCPCHLEGKPEKWLCGKCEQTEGEVIPEHFRTCPKRSL